MAFSRILPRFGKYFQSLCSHTRPHNVTVPIGARASSQYYPIDDDLFGLSDEQKQVCMFDVVVISFYF